MKTLFAKLSATLLAIVALMGAALFTVDRVNTRIYYEELSQKLNSPIAMYVTGQRDLISDGVPDLDSLRELASHAMVINPTAEIYLLDTVGNILGHALPPETVLRDSVGLGPIRSLIDETARFRFGETTPVAPQAARYFRHRRLPPPTASKVTCTLSSAARPTRHWRMISASPTRVR